MTLSTKIEQATAPDVVESLIRCHIPMDYLERHGADTVAAMRDYAEDRWKLIERLKTLQARPDAALAGEIEQPLRSALCFAASHSCITSAQEQAILSSLHTHDDTLEDAAKVCDEWCAENKKSAIDARKQGKAELAHQLDGAAIECNALSGHFRNLKGKDRT